jgi:gas vesicle protein
MSENFALEFIIDFYGILIGALIGIGLTVLARDVKEKRDKEKRKKELISHIEKEIDDMISSIKNPQSLNPKYKPFTYDTTSKVIQGGQLNMSLNVQDYVINSENLGIIPYDLVDALGKVVLSLNNYSKWIDRKNVFNTENDFVDELRRNEIAIYLINNLTDKTNDTLIHLKNVKKELEKIEKSKSSRFCCIR